jgi:hypothetical protein
MCSGKSSKTIYLCEKQKSIFSKDNPIKSLSSPSAKESSQTF